MNVKFVNGTPSENKREIKFKLSNTKRMSFVYELNARAIYICHHLQAQQSAVYIEYKKTQHKRLN